MNETPRTDLRALRAAEIPTLVQRFAWMTDFCRRLERENNALRDALLTARQGLSPTAVNDGTLSLIERVLVETKEKP